MKSIKNLKLFILTIVLSVLMSGSVFAEKPIQLWINGNYVTTDTDPIIENGRTLVPVRVISESLGYKVDWVPDEQKVAIYKPEFAQTGYGIFLYINNPVVSLYEDEEVTLDAAPKIINGRTMVPIRFIAETMGLKVDWDNANRTVVIGEGYTAPVSNLQKTPSQSVSSEDSLNTFKGIYDAYEPQVKEASVKFLNEYNAEYPSITTGDRARAELAADKLIKLTEITNNGVIKMDKLYAKLNNQDPDYLLYRNKLIDLYYAEEKKMYAAYDASIK